MADDANVQRCDVRQYAIARMRVCIWERWQGARLRMPCGHLAVSEICYAGAETVTRPTNNGLQYDLLDIVWALGCQRTKIDNIPITR